MFRKYLETCFLPWSIKIDHKNVIKNILKEREKYFCDTYNHFAMQFKELATYELFMFRVSQKKIIRFNYDMLFVKLPETNSLDESEYLIYVYDENSCRYFTVSPNLNFGYDLVVHEDNRSFKYDSVKQIDQIESKIIMYLGVKS